MPELNTPIPHFECLVRDQYLHGMQVEDEESFRLVGQGKFTAARVFGVRSHPNRALGFHVLLETGAQFAQLPIEALVARPQAPFIETNIAQLWDCFGAKITCTTYPMLAEAAAQVWLAFDPDEGFEVPELHGHPGTYMMTFDWWDNGWSDQPDQHKSAHLFKLDSGAFVLQPNNRIYPWNFPSFTTPRPDAHFRDAPDYRAQTAAWTCENRAPVQGDSSFFYGEAPQDEEEDAQSFGDIACDILREHARNMAERPGGGPTGRYPDKPNAHAMEPIDPAQGHELPRPKDPDALAAALRKQEADEARATRPTLSYGMVQTSELLQIMESLSDDYRRNPETSKTSLAMAHDIKLHLETRMKTISEYNEFRRVCNVMPMPKPSLDDALEVSLTVDVGGDGKLQVAQEDDLSLQELKSHQADLARMQRHADKLGEPWDDEDGGYPPEECNEDPDDV